MRQVCEQSAEDQSLHELRQGKGSLHISAGRAAEWGEFRLVGGTALACNIRQRCNEDESFCFWTAYAGICEMSWHQQSGEIEPDIISKYLKNMRMPKYTFGWLFYGSRPVRCSPLSNAFTFLGTTHL